MSKSDKIKKDNPLPDHTKLNYDECYAKLLLENVFYDLYSNLQISDKPDLIDQIHRIGIEVTWAASPQMKEATKLWYMIQFVDDKQKEMNIARMKKLGVDYTEGIQSWLCNNDLSIFFDALSNKINKLNSGNYAQLDCYDLFVLSELYIYNPDEILKKLQEINIGEKIYRYIYVVTNTNMIISFNTETGCFLTRDFNQIQFNISCKAREMAVEAENDQT